MSANCFILCPPDAVPRRASPLDRTEDFLDPQTSCTIPLQMKLPVAVTRGLNKFCSLWSYYHCYKPWLHVNMTLAVAGPRSTKESAWHAAHSSVRKFERTTPRRCVVFTGHLRCERLRWSSSVVCTLYAFVIHSTHVLLSKYRATAACAEWKEHGDQQVYCLYSQTHFSFINIKIFEHSNDTTAGGWSLCISQKTWYFTEWLSNQAAFGFIWGRGGEPSAWWQREGLFSTIQTQ